MHGHGRQMWTLSTLGHTETNSTQESKLRVAHLLKKYNPKVGYHIEDLTDGPRPTNCNRRLRVVYTRTRV